MQPNWAEIYITSVAARLFCILLLLASSYLVFSHSIFHCVQGGYLHRKRITMQFLALLLAVGCADLVIAHGHIQSLTVRGKTYQGYTQMDGKTQKGEIVGWAESKGDSGWLSPQDSTGPDGICHKNAVNAKYSVSVNAGDTINVEWNTWGCGDIRVGRHFFRHRSLVHHDSSPMLEVICRSQSHCLLTCKRFH